MHMSLELMQLAPLLLITPLLMAMALYDLKSLKIPNRLVLIMLAVFLFSAPVFLSFHEVAYRAFSGIFVFALGFVGFALRLWGGGDVKAIAVLSLFVPGSYLLLFAYIFSASMAAGIMIVFASRSILGHPQTQWSAMRPGAGYPMGVSIAMSGIILPLAAIVLLN